MWICGDVGMCGNRQDELMRSPGPAHRNVTHGEQVRLLVCLQLQISFWVCPAYTAGEHVSSSTGRAIHHLTECFNSLVFFPGQRDDDATQ